MMCQLFILHRNSFDRYNNSFFSVYREPTVKHSLYLLHHLIKLQGYRFYCNAIIYPIPSPHRQYAHLSKLNIISLSQYCREYQ